MCAMPEVSLTAENPVTVTAPMLVYDGSCGFCSRSVQFILRHERSHDLLFVTRDSPLGQELRRHFHLEAVESMLWIDGDKAAIESSAVLARGAIIWADSGPFSPPLARWFPRRYAIGAIA